MAKYITVKEKRDIAAKAEAKRVKQIRAFAETFRGVDYHTLSGDMQDAIDYLELTVKASIHASRMKPKPFYVTRNIGLSVFVKEGAFFEEQGGLIEPWGKFWRKVMTFSIEEARAIGDSALPKGPTPEGDPACVIKKKVSKYA